jgi:hypothetical protein
MFFAKIAQQGNFVENGQAENAQKITIFDVKK